jgi:L-glutamine---4-(methylsulfanyl)-2-oxobutanoate aminotransferase
MASHRIDHPHVAERVQVFPESVIRDMTRVAMKDDAVNLSQGFPDFDPPLEIMEAAKKAIDDGHNQYAITWGAPPLREAIARKMKSFNKIDAHPDKNIVVTCGATEAMMASLLSIINPGDKAVIFTPYYENFGPDAVVSGAQPLWVPLNEPDYQPDEEALKAAFAERPKAVLVNTPGNPTGRIFTDESLKLIADLCQEHDTVAVTDEIYEHMVYDGLKHTSIATLGDMHERTITICGFSKTYSVTGWRLAYTVAPEPITRAIKRVHDFLTVGAAHPLQIAGAAALELPQSYYTWLEEAYAKKRDILLEGLQKAGFKCHRPNAAYYIMTDISDFGFPDATTFAYFLSQEVGVTPVPGSCFYPDPESGQQKVRFAFPKKEETLQEASRRLAETPEKAQKAAKTVKARTP